MQNGVGQKNKLQRYGAFMHHALFEIDGALCVTSVSSAQTEEGEQRVDPLFEDIACSAALRRSFMALNSSSSF